MGEVRLGQRDFANFETSLCPVGLHLAILVGVKSCEVLLCWWDLLIQVARKQVQKNFSPLDFPEFYLYIQKE